MRIEDGMVIDAARHHALWLDTPAGCQSSTTREETAKRSGCAVKSLEREGGWRHLPVHHGRLAAYDEAADRVCVIGYDDPVSPPFVWEGTVAEYVALWECN